jgi:hypothetical protein
MINQTASESGIHSVVRDAVVDLDFCVSIVDPRSNDERLIAVSDGFEKMTGYPSEEVVGKNCRFLNDGCEMQPWQRRGLRVASKTGAHFSAVIVNRKKSGEFFKNFINVRGLVIAQHIQTGEDLWLLVGIHADVSGLDEVPKDHLTNVARCIRRKLVKQFAVLSISAVLRAGGVKLGDGEASEWRVGLDVVWKTGCVANNPAELVQEDGDLPQGAVEALHWESDACPQEEPAIVIRGPEGVHALKPQTFMMQAAFCTAAACVLLMLARLGLRDAKRT